MIAELPFRAGCVLGRAAALPVLFLGFLIYAATSFSRKLKKNVKSVLRFVLSLAFSISAFLLSLAALQAAKEVEYDLRQLLPPQAHSVAAAVGGSLSSLLAQRWCVLALEYAQEYLPFASKAVVAAILVPLFTNGIPAFLATMRWFICLIPNFLLGFYRGVSSCFEYIICAASLTNHRNHPDW
jgi:hypothetical protein